MHSGVGRIGRPRMRTIFLYESRDSSGQVSLNDLCNGVVKQTLTGNVDIRKLAYLIFEKLAIYDK